MNSIERMESRRLLSGGEIDTTFGNAGSTSLQFGGDGGSGGSRLELVRWDVERLLVVR
jgi:hypothetical protein